MVREGGGQLSCKFGFGGVAVRKQAKILQQTGKIFTRFHALINNYCFRPVKQRFSGFFHLRMQINEIIYDLHLPQNGIAFIFLTI